jgi:S-adenosylmethionine:tRNA ribosyltransferase-isomerase
VNLSDFDYSLDHSLIAQHPVPERDRSRLLVLDRFTGGVQHRFFYELIDYLQSGDLLIINDSKVLSARLPAWKEKTGGRIEFLLIRPYQENVWFALVNGRYRLGQRVLFKDGSGGEIVGKASDDQIYVRLERKTDIPKWMEKVGLPPLPPYIKRQELNGSQKIVDQRTYQTVYAAYPGSVAAPTAGLHFTRSLISNLRKKSVNLARITLHVGPGTFRPVRSALVEDHTMDSEYVRIPARTALAIQTAKQSGGRIIAVGTTCVRSLEAAVNEKGELSAFEGWTDLFILPGYRFKLIDGLITNFHLPRSTLLMLVSAFAGRQRILETYHEAMNHRYRFYSFGDAMLIL